MCGNTGAISTIARVSGADVNVRNTAGGTPLMLAVKCKNAAAVETLLRLEGVDIEVEDEDERSLEDLARQWAECEGRRDSRFRADMSKVMLVMISRARERRERELREQQMREVRERARRRRAERELQRRSRHVEHDRRHSYQADVRDVRLYQRILAGNLQASLSGNSGDEDDRLQEIVRSQMSRLGIRVSIPDEEEVRAVLNDLAGLRIPDDVEEVTVRSDMGLLALFEEEDTVEAVVEEGGDDSAEEYVVVVAGGETVDRIEEITGDREEEAAVAVSLSKPVIKREEKKEEIEINQDDESGDELNKSVNEISGLVEKKIQEILSKLEKVNIKILEREKSLKPLEDKHEKERRDLKHSQVMEEGEHYTEFREEIQELSEVHEKELEDLQSMTDSHHLNMRLHQALHRLEDEENELQKSQESRIIAMFVKHEAEMKELKQTQKVEAQDCLAEDSALKNFREKKKDLSRHLAKLTSKPEVVPCPECPVCYESMKPPARILQCVNGHLTCVECAKRMER